MPRDIWSDPDNPFAEPHNSFSWKFVPDAMTTTQAKKSSIHSSPSPSPSKKSPADMFQQLSLIPSPPIAPKTNRMSSSSPLMLLLRVFVFIFVILWVGKQLVTEIIRLAENPTLSRLYFHFLLTFIFVSLLLVNLHTNWVYIFGFLRRQQQQSYTRYLEKASDPYTSARRVAQDTVSFLRKEKGVLLPSLFSPPTSSTIIYRFMISMTSIICTIIFLHIYQLPSMTKIIATEKPVYQWIWWMLSKLLSWSIWFVGFSTFLLRLVGVTVKDFAVYLMYQIIILIVFVMMALYIVNNRYRSFISRALYLLKRNAEYV